MCDAILARRCPVTARERTGWRDARLSRLHRRWCVDCPAVDVDFLLVEFDSCEPRALIEYKHERASLQRHADPQPTVLRRLGNLAGLPVFAVRYADDLSWFRATPLNARARDYLATTTQLDELGLVSLLYRLRGRAVPAHLADEIRARSAA